MYLCNHVPTNLMCSYAHTQTQETRAPKNVKLHTAICTYTYMSCIDTCGINQSFEVIVCHILCAHREQDNKHFSSKLPNLTARKKEENHWHLRCRRPRYSMPHCSSRKMTRAFVQVAACEADLRCLAKWVALCVIHATTQHQTKALTYCRIRDDSNDNGVIALPQGEDALLQPRIIISYVGTVERCTSNLWLGLTWWMILFRDERIETGMLWTWNKILIRSNGATHVFAVAPAKPPATRDLKVIIYADHLCADFSVFAEMAVDIRWLQCSRPHLVLTRSV